MSDAFPAQKSCVLLLLNIYFPFCPLLYLQIEKENMQAAIDAAVKAERENLEKLHALEKKEWQAEQEKERAKIAQAIEDAVLQQRESSQVRLVSLIHAVTGQSYACTTRQQYNRCSHKMVPVEHTALHLSSVLGHKI